MHKIIFDKSDFRYASAALASDGGTLVAAAVRCSQNIEKGISWGYGEIVAKVSTDGGESWSEEKAVAVPPARKITAEEGNTKSAFFQNPVLLAAKSGGFVMLFTFFPESMGAEEIQLLDKKKAAYTYYGGRNLPLIYDRDGNYFVVCDDGSVLDAKKNSTDYTVKGMGELYSGDEYIGNIYLNGAMGRSDGLGKTRFGAPLKAPKRSYIMMSKSDDGINWSEPCDISSSIYNDADGVTLMTGRGNGTVSESGRMFVPMVSDKGVSCIYSLDEGESWSRNQRIPYMPTKDDETSFVALPDVLLALGKKWCVSHDRGITWMKTSAKATPSKAILAGGKIQAIVNFPKIGTYLLGCNVTSKKGRFKGVKTDKETAALSGALSPSCDLARIDSGLGILSVSDDNTSVAFDKIEI